MNNVHHYAAAQGYVFSRLFGLTAQNLNIFIL